MAETGKAVPMHIQISVAAVGGMDTPLGQQMYQALMDAEAGIVVEAGPPVSPPLPPAPGPALLDRPAAEEDAALMPETLNQLFGAVFLAKDG